MLPSTRLTSCRLQVLLPSFYEHSLARERHRLAERALHRRGFLSAQRTEQKPEEPIHLL